MLAPARGGFRTLTESDNTDARAQAWLTRTLLRKVTARTIRHGMSGLICLAVEERLSIHFKILYVTTVPYTLHGEKGYITFIFPLLKRLHWAIPLGEVLHKALETQGFAPLVLNCPTVH